MLFAAGTALLFWMLDLARPALWPAEPPTESPPGIRFARTAAPNG